MAIRFSGTVACFRIVRLGGGDGSVRVNEPYSDEHFSRLATVMTWL
jgi:hypothetical protein